MDGNEDTKETYKKTAKLMYEVSNRVDYNVVYSNLSHPDLTSDSREFRKVVCIDKKFAKHWLTNEFRRCDMIIGDRYVIKVRGRYWYRQGRNIYLLERV